MIQLPRIIALSQQLREEREAHLCKPLNILTIYLRNELKASEVNEVNKNDKRKEKQALSKFYLVISMMARVMALS